MVNHELSANFAFYNVSLETQQQIIPELNLRGFLWWRLGTAKVAIWTNSKAAKMICISADLILWKLHLSSFVVWLCLISKLPFPVHRR